MIPDDAYARLEDAVGPENASREPSVLDCYAWQPFANDDPRMWNVRPEAVVLPGTTEEVQDVVRACCDCGLKFKAFSTGWGAYSSPTSDGVVQVDLRRMDRILDIDEENMFAVIEPYVCGGQLQAEAMKVGLNTHIIGAGPACSPLASATSAFGVGWDGAYMSYSGRNLLGAEWVLPDGGLLGLGTVGSRLGWFSGDGPGPSLRGLTRGSTGALSGLGIFTKCAIKLFNWPGPPDMEVEGILLDASSRIPDNVMFAVCAFPDRRALDEATYRIGEHELAYIFTRTSIPAFAFLSVPRLMKKVLGTRVLREVLGQEQKHSATVVMAANSEAEISYQEKVLRRIVSDLGGIVYDFTKARPILSTLLMNFFRVSAIPMIFRMGGSFFTALGRNDTWDTQMNWADSGEVIKRKWIEKECILDDMADNPFMALYENNTWAHCEEIFQYDPRNRRHRSSLLPIFVDFSVEAIEQCMEPLSSIDARLRKVISPLMGDYNRWQRDISGTFDSSAAADTGMYCDEADLDCSRVEPSVIDRFRKALADKGWVGPDPFDQDRE